MSAAIHEFGFFFGAGASAPFDVPTMKKMTDDFTNEARQHPEGDLYVDIKEKLDGELGRDQVDVESIFSVIEGLKTFNDEELGYLAIYAARNFLNSSLLHQSINEVRPRIGGLENRFQQFVRRECRLRTSHRQKIRTVYRHFFDTIASVGGHIASPSGAKYHSSWVMFTTNYDRCLEAYWREDARVNLLTGFAEQQGRFVLDPPSFLRREGPLLIKLHGSTTWLRNHTTGLIEEKEYDIEVAQQLSDLYAEEVVIYPLAQKALYLEPYVQMLLRLGEEVRARKAWVVVGYSFRDPVVRHIFVNYLRPEQRLVLVHPRASDIINSRLGECDARIIPIDDRFGEENFEDINTRILQAATA